MGRNLKRKNRSPTQAQMEFFMHNKSPSSNQLNYNQISSDDRNPQIQNLISSDTQMKAITAISHFKKPKLLSSHNATTHRTIEDEERLSNYLFELAHGKSTTLDLLNETHPLKSPRSDKLHLTRSSSGTPSF
ncbi:hypothetical protein CASFOL_005788 [Castilleja foliolosa]|uniref:Uncharacterized protein n=1 Tax=Castilleja foliolosa TaxID=1961234 RepID=A0ABD3E4F6_9LAMI